MVRSRGLFRRRLRHVRRPAVFLAAVLVASLPLTSCATMFNGTTQLVPVTSRPERAEVFVDGISMGFTPVEVALPRRGDVTIDVRLGDRVRSFALRSETQGAMVGLDLVPVGVTGGFVIFIGALGAGLGGGITAEGYVAAAGLLGASLTPLLVDYGTGALFRLQPGEIVAVFD